MWTHLECKSARKWSLDLKTFAYCFSREVFHLFFLWLFFFWFCDGYRWCSSHISLQWLRLSTITFGILDHRQAQLEMRNNKVIRCLGLTTDCCLNCFCFIQFRDWKLNHVSSTLKLDLKNHSWKHQQHWPLINHIFQPIAFQEKLKAIKLIWPLHYLHFVWSSIVEHGLQKKTS